MKLMKKRKLIWVLVVLLLLAWPLHRIGGQLGRELYFSFAELTETELTIQAFAREHGLKLSDYPQSLVSLLERNPETETFVLEYPLKKNDPVTMDLSEYQSSKTVPLFLQWDQRWGYERYGDDMAAITGCGPMCLSMAAFYLTGDTDYAPDRMLEFAAKNGYYAKGYGSSWTLISEGGKKLGFSVTELPLVKSKIVKKLQAGNPVICVLGPGDFTTTGHFIVLTGIQDGKFQVNDPNSVANSQKLWSYETMEGQIRNIWAIENG